MDHLPNPIRKPVETQKILHCWITFLIQSENVETQKNITLLDHLPNPIRKIQSDVENKQKNIPHCWSTFLIQSEKM